MCKIAREFNLSSLMVLGRGVFSLFILLTAVHVETGYVNSVTSATYTPG